MVKHDCSTAKSKYNVDGVPHEIHGYLTTNNCNKNENTKSFGLFSHELIVNTKRGAVLKF